MTTAALATKTFVDPRFDGRGAKPFDLSHGGIKAVGQASPEDMARINGLALKPLSPDEVAVYTLRVCSNQVDRDGERFSDDVLQDFQQSLPGKSLLEGHDWGPVGIGRFIDADLVTEGGVTWLMGRCYLDRQDPESAQMIRKLDTGIAWADSVGFFAPERVAVMGADGAPMFSEYRRGAHGEKAEAIEVSLVFLGAQYDAAVAKRANAATEKHVREVWQTRAAVHAAPYRQGFFGALKQLVEHWFGPGELLLDPPAGPRTRPPAAPPIKCPELPAGILYDREAARYIDMATGEVVEQPEHRRALAAFRTEARQRLAKAIGPDADAPELIAALESIVEDLIDALSSGAEAMGDLRDVIDALQGEPVVPDEDERQQMPVAKRRLLAAVRRRCVKVVPSNPNDAKADPSTPWSRPTLNDFTSKGWTELSEAERRHIAQHFAWADRMPPETYGDLKLPHHRPSDGAVVLAGVSAAAGRMNQTDGIDQGAVRSHLAAHYRDFGQTPPWEGKQPPPPPDPQNVVYDAETGQCIDMDTGEVVPCPGAEPARRDTPPGGR